MSLEAPTTIDRDQLETVVRSAFPDGSSPLEPMVGGASGASVFAFEAENRRWVVRHSPYKGTERLRIASENAVGPVLRHVDVANEIAIMERFDGFPAPAFRDPESRALLAKALARLHEGPAFPPNISSADFHALVRGEYEKRTHEELPAALTELLADCAARSKDVVLAPCHRDLNPGNVLVQRPGTPSRRVCILDWDSAGAGDPFLDVAQLCVFYALSLEARVDFFRDYLGHEPTDAERSRIEGAHVYALAAYALSFAFVLALRGQKLGAEPKPLPEVFLHLRDHGPNSDAGLVSASFLAEAQRLAAGRS